MRKLSAVGVIAAGALGLSLQANAQVIYDITGSIRGVENACTQITYTFALADCSYGSRRPAAIPGNWVGPTFNGGWYAVGSAGDNLNYRQAPNYTLPIGDDKIDAPITGTLTINDNGTPGNPADDLISATFSIGPAARNVQTGQFTYAIERWDAINHVMAATPVSAATANGAGGVDYIIGIDGFPALIFNFDDPTDVFPSENADTATPPTSIWDGPEPNGIGIERSPLLAGNFAGGDTTGNNGATTVGTLVNPSCSDLNVQNGLPAGECAINPFLWVAGEGPGFDNLVMKISTNAAGTAISAEIFWTQEYFIGAFGPPPGVDNSWQAGTMALAGLAQGTAPEARDDAFTVIENSVNNSLNVLANDVNFTAPVTVVVTVNPNQGGTATVNPNNTISYTPAGGFAGQETFTYEVTGSGEDEVDDAVVTVTVQADIEPVAPDGTIAVNTQGGANTAGTRNVTTLPGYSPGNTPATITIVTNADPATQGTCTITGGNTVSFARVASFVGGGSTATCVYRITDANGDTDDGTITITVTDVTPTVNNGSATGNQDTVLNAAAAFTAGNGSVAQHTLAVQTQPATGTCAASVSGANIAVTYTPAAGTFGVYTCVVRLTDADGDFGDGTFTFTVNEVADEILLPGGRGSFDLWSLALLAGLPLLRRRRQSRSPES